MSTEGEERFPLLRKMLKVLGLPAEAIDDIIERILDWLADKNAPTGESRGFPFQLRDDFLSPAELNFYFVLRPIVTGRAQICPKVALGDLFFAKAGDLRENRICTNRIDRKHVDFLLCDSKTLRPIVGIELDDSSHTREDRQKRDAFVNGVFAAAKLPLLRIPVKTGYVPAEIELLLKPYLAPTPEPPSLPLRATPTPEGKRSCPKCGADMVLRTAKTGANAGGQFWGCSNFPKCRMVLTDK